jgi:dihydrofolate synthase/folylpolyglutamate synthase
MDYQEAWSYLDDLQFFKIKLRLDSMFEFLDSIGHPQDSLKFVHVGGTNGKGSVSVNLLTIMSKADYKVGLYTSPHLSSVRERFRINDNYISEEDFARHATTIRDTLGEKQITYFEFTTALALLWFVEQGVDIAIMEVGLGGRLDATNVITPLVSVITNVSMDHEVHLGKTLGDIAYEKAGIVKPGIPVVSGVASDESRHVLESTCLENGSSLYILGQEFYPEFETATTWTYRAISGSRGVRGLHGSLAGNYQVDNAAVALAALDILADKGFPVDDQAIQEALPEVRWPGRLESFCLTEPGMAKVDCADMDVHDLDGYRRYLLDGAHNPAGVKNLVEYFNTLDDYRDLVMIWASMADKDYMPALAMIAPLCRLMIFVSPDEERSATPEMLIKALPPEYRERAEGCNSVKKALATARQMTDSNDLICAAGSLYLVGAIRSMLLGEIV